MYRYHNTFILNIDEFKTCTSKIKWWFTVLNQNHVGVYKRTVFITKVVIKSSIDINNELAPTFRGK